MSKDEEPHNPKYITSKQCDITKAYFQEELQTIKKALVGDDMRGGMVSDLADLKSKLSIVKTVLLPVAISVVSALLVAWVATGSHIG